MRNENLKEIQLKLSDLERIKQERSNSWGIEIEKDLLYSVKNELNMIMSFDFTTIRFKRHRGESFPTIEEQTEKIEKTKKLENLWAL